MEEFYREFSPSVRAFLFSLCRDPHRAEDLLQETFVRALRFLAGFRGESPRAWLFAIARNVFLDDAAKNRWEQVGEIEDVPIDTRIEEFAAVLQVLASLPEPQRAALVLRDQLGMSYDEVSQTLGKSLAATKVLIHRARATFRAAYGES